MDIIRNMFKDRKNLYNIIVAIFLGIMLIIISGDFLKNDDKVQTEISNDLIAYNNTSSNNDSYEEQLETRLKKVLSEVQGVGKVEVMVTTESSKEIVTKSDVSSNTSITKETSSNGDERNSQSNTYEDNTVKINNDEPLILKELSPKVLGVLIVAEGGNNIEVKNSLIKATDALLNVGTHKIEVLPMK